MSYDSFGDDKWLMDRQLDVLQCQLRVTLCADSLLTFGALAEDLVKLVPKEECVQYNLHGVTLTLLRPSADTMPFPASLEQSINVFGERNEPVEP